MSARSSCPSGAAHRDDGVFVVNLGCVRNTVDSHTIIETFRRKGFSFVPLEKAGTVIVNTCAFTEDARKESVDMILDLLGLKKEGRIKRVVVAGCLAQRYGMDLAAEMKEVDAFVGVQALSREALQAYPYLTPPHYAYVKICESCFNACSFCVIPKIKGKFVSRSMEAVVGDVKRLEEQKVREINIIGQDVTAYGMDIYRRKALPELLKKVSKATSAPWVRILYTHPAHVTDALLDEISRNPRICKYLDMPLQHVSDGVLKRMNRGMTYASTVALMNKIRRRVPRISLRTTFITGFPGETKEDFDRLFHFVKEYKFERVGVFTYSREEGTPAYHMPDQVPHAVALRRHDLLMKLQQEISQKANERLIGTTMQVLIEEKQKDAPGHYWGRSEFDAPDVDGAVDVHAGKDLHVGVFAKVRITGAMPYDLQGEAV